MGSKVVMEVLSHAKYPVLGGLGQCLGLLRLGCVRFDGFLTDQINPLIANVVVNLSKGAVSAAPIQVQNVWHIIKVDDIRNFVVPKFDDAKGQIRQALQMRQLSEYVSQIILAAKVQLAD